MGNQKINCTVCSCRYHSNQNTCELQQINIKASKNCSSGKTEESECGSYITK